MIATLAPGASAGVRDANGFKFLLTDPLGSMVSMIEDGVEGDPDDMGSILSE